MEGPGLCLGFVIPQQGRFAAFKARRDQDILAAAERLSGLVLVTTYLGNGLVVWLLAS